MSKNKDAVNIFSGNRLPDKEYDGQWKFEAVYADGRVEPLADFHNDPTELWGEYNNKINKYRELSFVPQVVDPMIPAAIGIYEDDTAVDLRAGVLPKGKLVGFIDLTSTNPIPTNVTEGFRLTAEFKEERVSPGVVKLTYKGEFPTSTANGRATKIRMFGMPMRQSWDSSYRSVSKDALYGVKPDTMVGANSLMHPVPMMSALNVGLFADSSFTIPPTYTLKSYVNGTVGYRLRHSVSAAGNLRYSLLEDTPVASSPKVFIMPIIGSQYQNTPLNGRNQLKAPPLATIVLPTVADEKLYQLGSASFHGENWLMVTRAAEGLVINYYDASNGYSLTQTLIPINRYSGWPTSKMVCLAASVKNGILYILESLKSNASSTTATYDSEKVAVMHHVDLSNMALLVTDRTIDYRAVTLGYTLETDTSYSSVVIGEVVYDEASNGYFLSAWTYGAAYSSWDDVGWTWMKNAPILASDEMLGMGKMLGGYTPSYAYNATLWHSRAHYARGGGGNKSIYVVSEPLNPDELNNSSGVSKVLYDVDGETAYVGNSTTLRCALAPLMLYRSTILTEAAMPEVTKTEAFGLRISYELTITEIE